MEAQTVSGQEPRRDGLAVSSIRMSASQFWDILVYSKLHYMEQEGKARKGARDQNLTPGSVLWQNTRNLRKIGILGIDEDVFHVIWNDKQP